MIGGVVDGALDSINNLVGAAWLYKNNGTGWANPIKIIPTNNLGTATDFGDPIVFSPNDQTLLIGGYWDNTKVGAVWKYDYIDDLQIVNNQMTVINGFSTILNTNNILANDTDSTDSKLTFTPNNLQHGTFELVDAPGTPLTNFTQLDLDNTEIQFTPDNSSLVPSYQLFVTDGIANVGPSSPSILYSSNSTSMPTITTVNIIINPGQTSVIITPIMVSSSGGTNLTFRVTSSTCGHFENVDNPGVAITSFTQQEINDGEIKFVYTSSNTGNCFQITVDNGTFRSSPQGGLLSLLGSSDNSYIIPVSVVAGAVALGVAGVLIAYKIRPDKFSFVKNYEHEQEKQRKTQEEMWEKRRTEIVKRTSVPGSNNPTKAETDGSTNI